MDAKKWDFHPTNGRASELRERVELELVDEIVNSVGAIETALGLTGGTLSPVVPVVDPRMPMASTAYVANWQLGTGLRSNDRALVSKGLKTLSLAQHAPLGVSVGTYRGDAIDHAAEDYIASDEGQRKPFYAATGATPRDVHRGLTPSNLGPVDEDALPGFRELVALAMEKIGSIDVAMVDEIAQLVREVRMVSSDRIGGMSSMRFYGTVFIRPPVDPRSAESDLAQIVSALVHETSHLCLHGMMTAEPLVINGDERFESPLRRDPRPMSGIFHAVFVLARLAYIFGLWSKEVPASSVIQSHLDDSRSRLDKGLEVVRQNAELTPAGSELMGSIQRVYSA